MINVGYRDGMLYQKLMSAEIYHRIFYSQSLRAPESIKACKEDRQFHFGALYDVQICTYLFFIVVAGLVDRSVGSVGYEICGIIRDRLLDIQLLKGFANVAVIVQDGVLRQIAFDGQIPVKCFDMPRPQFLHRNSEIMKILVNTAMDISPVGTIGTAVKLWRQSFQPQHHVVTEWHLTDRCRLLLISAGSRFHQFKDPFQIRIVICAFLTQQFAQRIQCYFRKIGNFL